MCWCMGLPIDKLSKGMNMKLAFIGVFGLSVLLGGCGKFPISLDKSISDHQSYIDQPVNGVLVSIRYPAKFSQKAIEKFRDQYLRYPLREASVCSEDPQAFEDSIVKTSFYAQDLYKYLRDHPPKGSVIIEPASVDIKNDSYVYTGINRELPEVLNIDFFSYNNPLMRPSVYRCAPYTIGEYTAPIIIGSTSASSFFESGGIAFSTELISANNNDDVKGAFIINSISKKINGGIKLSFSYPIHGNIGFGLPLAFYEGTQVEWVTYLSKFSSGDPLSAYVNGGHQKELGNIIIESLKLINQDATLSELRGHYRRLYLEKGDMDSGDTPLFRAVEMAEAKFMSQRSDSIVKYFDKNVTPSIINQITAERQQNDALRGAGKQALMQMAAGMSAAGGNMSAMNTSVLQSYMGMVQQSAAINNAYDTSLAASKETITEVIIPVGDQQMKVTATSLEELRDKLKKVLLKSGGKS